MTAQNTLRAALEKRNIYFDDWTAMTWVAILEAMEQHRRAGIEEVEKFVDTIASSSPAKSTAITRGMLAILKHKLTALKTNTSG